MLILRDTNTTPREKRWIFPDVTGEGLVSTNSYMNLLIEVGRHYRGNGKSVPSEQEVIEYCCRNLSVPCYEQDGSAFRNRYTDPPRSNKPSNGTRWGVFTPLKLLAKDGDRGLGSIIERTIAPFGSQQFKDWYKKITGQSCGCSERRDEWDEIYPL